MTTDIVTPLKKNRFHTMRVLREKISAKEKAWLFTLILFSLVYLVVELSFSSRLLDVVWNSTDIESIEGVEHYGRLISGFAVWLAFFGFIVFSAIKHSKTFLWVSLSVVLGLPSTLFLVYHGQEKLVDSIVNGASTDELRRSFYASVLSNAYKAGDVSLDGAEFNQSEHAQGGDVKTFGSLLPFLAMNTPNFEEKLERDTRKIIKRQILDEIDTPQEVFKEAFQKPRDELTKKYNDYLKGSNKYRSERNKYKERQSAEWDKYTDRVYRHYGKEPSQIRNKFQIKQIRIQTRKNMDELPFRWNIADRTSFNKVIKNRVLKEAKGRYKQAVIKRSGFYIRPGLSESQFVNLKDIKKQWNDSFSDSEFKNRIPSVNSTFKTFVKNQYNPMINDKVDDELQKLKASDADLIPGGKYYSDAQKAMKMTVVPIIALLFSLVGGIFHIAKITMMLIKFVFIAPVAMIIAATALLYAGWYPLQKNTEVTDSSLYQYMKENMNERIELPVRWVIHLEKEYYPINEWLRVNLMNSVEFSKKQ